MRITRIMWLFYSASKLVATGSVGLGGLGSNGTESLCKGGHLSLRAACRGTSKFRDRDQAQAGWALFYCKCMSQKGEIRDELCDTAFSVFRSLAPQTLCRR